VKRVSLCLLTMLLWAGIARAQEPDEPPPNPEMIRQELINLEKENARAIKLHNPTFFKSAYSEDFTGVTRYGEVLNKAAIIREVQSMPQEFDSVVSSDPQVRMFRDTASVLSMRSEVGRLNGKNPAHVHQHVARLESSFAAGDHAVRRRTPLAGRRV